MNKAIKIILIFVLGYLFINFVGDFKYVFLLLAAILFSTLFGKEKEIERIPIKQSIRSAVFKRDKYTCRHCGKKPPEVTLEVDHKIPFSWNKKIGNPDNIDAYQTLCRDCNIGKGDKFAD